MRLLLLDNYDSFTWNLWDLLHQAAATLDLSLQVDVVANDASTSAALLAAGYDGAVLSPGPKAPHEAGILLEFVRAAWGRLPLWGVCLGHQALAAAWGGQVVRAPMPTHGKTGQLLHTGWGPLESVPPASAVMRYHSLCVDPILPPQLHAVGWLCDDPALIMAVAATDADAFGVQFHPESCATPGGLALTCGVLQWMRAANRGRGQR